jgi:hypothetical protein
MRTEELLKIQESHLDLRGSLKKKPEFIVQNKNSAVVGMLETVRLYVFVDRASNSAPRYKRTLG